jgi:DNA invertase Pin-like site-specific DNA recombinase
MAAAVQRRAVEGELQRFTLRVTRRTVPIIFSMMFVQASERRSSAGKPSLVTVRISSNPSRHWNLAPMPGPNNGNFVAYYRVSTQRQGRSGLGLEAQQNAVREHLNGGNWRIVADFTEVESGKRSDRPKLAEALKTCRALGATLIIAKLDRLARNVHFVSGLMESGVEFTAVDFPQANRLTVHILAAVAEHEAKMISERTKAALAAAKRRGVKLGGNRGARLTPAAQRAGTEARQARAAQRAADLAPIVKDLQAAGATSLRAIAAALNERRISTPRGTGQWQANTVAQLLARMPA